jgi:catechol 2,3-dioxygenase-like lactoylglutathione lyase family enzyme
MIKSFQCINISSKDIATLVEFYNGKLGIPIISEGYGDYDGIELGFIKDAPVICIWDENKWGAYEGKVTLVFKTDGLERTYSELKTKGLNVEPPLVADWGGMEIRMKDPDNNNILLLE